MSQSPQSIIEQAWENRANLSIQDVSDDIRKAVNAVLGGLNTGHIRVAEKKGVGQWEVNQWVKKAVLLSFRLEDNKPMGAGGYTQFYDKVPSKFENFTAADFAAGGYRVVPPAMARRGCFIGKNVVLMPSYVNIGAYVDEGTMVDTWATVGSCAQIGKNVHLSGGVGIGGVLEPFKPDPSLLKITALSAPAQKSLRVSSLKKIAFSPWVYTLAKVPKFMIVILGKSIMVAYQQARLWCQAHCLQAMANTASMRPLLLKKSMRKRGPKPLLMSYYATKHAFSYPFSHS